MRRIHAVALVPGVLSFFLGRGPSLAAHAGERSPGEIDQAAEVGEAIQLALDWLAAHQSPDGSWDCDGFAQLCAEKGAPACTGPGSSKHDVGVTGLALLALLRAGGTPAEGKHDDALDSYAIFLRLRLNGKRTFMQESDSGETINLDPMEWLLDCLFYPEVAVNNRHFIVDNVY